MIRSASMAYFCFAFALSSAMQLPASDFIPVAGSPEGWFVSGNGAISGDGGIAIGAGAKQPGAPSGFRWSDAHGLELIPSPPSELGSYAIPVNCSTTGDVIVGFATPDDREVETQAFRWTMSGGFVGLSHLATSDVRSAANDVSADGQVVVGYSSSDDGRTEAFHWSQSTGMIGLGDLPGGAYYSLASAVSGDGKTIVGESSSSEGQIAFRWTNQTGIQSLGALPVDAFGSTATAISGDGKTIAGAVYGLDDSVGSTSRMYVWTEGAGIQVVSGLPGASFYLPRATSFDGQIILADQWNSSELPERDQHTALIWDAAHGMRDLQQVLINDYGLGPQLAGWNLAIPSDISDDGLSIVGGGYDPQGQQHAWLVRLDHPLTAVPEPSAALLASLAALAAWRTSFGASSGTSSQGDANGDGIVDGADFLAWQHGNLILNATGATVPEPSTLVLAFSLLALSFRRWSHS
jgi:probable HAF family extracellular repeat protein